LVGLAGAVVDSTNLVVLLFGSYDQVIEPALTCTRRDEVSNNHIFLSSYKAVCFARIAASLNTFVVSWNEAADSQLSVFRDALGDPCKVGRDTADNASRTSTVF